MRADGKASQSEKPGNRGTDTTFEIFFEIFQKKAYPAPEASLMK